MQLTVVTDIFGKTKYLDRLIEEIAPQYTTVDIIDPYDNAEIDFKDEEDAYAYFQKNIGLDGYIAKLHDKLQEKPSTEQLILGFSVGASAIWAVSGILKFPVNTKGICFYSSQLRNYLEVTPKIEMDFYFSRCEPRYDVKELRDVIAAKVNVKCFGTDYLHGFMNVKSKNFDSQGYNKYLKVLKQSV